MNAVLKYNACLIYKKNKLQLSVKKRKLLFFEFNEFNEVINVEEPKVEDERLKQLHLAIANLDKVEKAIMMMHLDGKSNEEIAEIVGITQNYVRVKMNRIKKKISKKIKIVQSAPPKNLKSSLERFIKTIKAAVRFNVYSGTFINSLVITWFYYAFTYQSKAFVWNAQAILLLVLPIGLGIIYFYLLRYIQHLKFGNYINRLKEILTSLD